MKRRNVLMSAIVFILLSSTSPVLALDINPYSSSYIDLLESKIIEDTENLALALEAVKANPEALSLYETSNMEYNIAQDKLYASIALLKDATATLYDATFLWESASNNLLLVIEYRNGSLSEEFKTRLNTYNVARKSFKENPRDLNLYHSRNKAYQDFRNIYAISKIARSLYLSQKGNPLLLEEIVKATHLAMVLAQKNLDESLEITISDKVNFNTITVNIKNSWANNSLLQSYLDAYAILKTDEELLGSVQKANSIRQ